MMKYIWSLLLVSMIHGVYGQNIIGYWETYDDDTQEKKGIVEIYQQDQKYFARITKSFVEGKSGFCDTCQGHKKGQAIEGLVIIENLVKNGATYSEGTILDPDNGEVYRCYVELIDDQTLKVRGYIGFSIFGRTQYWKKVWSDTSNTTDKH